MAVDTGLFRIPDQKEGESNVLKLDEIKPPKLEDRKTEELVIAFVGAVGSGASTSAQVVKNILERDFAYETEVIKLSSLINENAHKVKEQKIADNDRERIEHLQSLGNKLRKKFGNNILAEYCVEMIHNSRPENERAENVRKCWIIDSLKHTSEAEILRDVYGDCFWLIAVFAPEDVRIQRLEELNLNNSYIEQIKKTDFDEGLTYGQSVKDVLNYADFFIRNDGFNKSNLENPLKRFLNLIFGIGVVTPTQHESAMLAAEGQASRSACLSRQVGAVIVSSGGEQIGQGCNDVPKFNGGLYSEGEKDQRCFKWKEQICHNDKHKNLIYQQVAEKAELAPDSKIEKIFSQTDIKNLIEFSRAIHAEMEAILSVARKANFGIMGSDLYTTTFPCHNCARHIVAAGIHRVFYIEAYPKSRALKLHDDAISTSENDSGKKVLFLQYEGAAPKSFNRLFGIRPARKKDGKLLPSDPLKSRPLAAPPMDGLATREMLTMARFKELETRLD